MIHAYIVTIVYNLPVYYWPSLKSVKQKKKQQAFLSRLSPPKLSGSSWVRVEIDDNKEVLLSDSTCCSYVAIPSSNSLQQTVRKDSKSEQPIYFCDHSEILNFFVEHCKTVLQMVKYLDF